MKRWLTLALVAVLASVAGCSATEATSAAPRSTLTAHGARAASPSVSRRAAPSTTASPTTDPPTTAAPAPVGRPTPERRLRLAATIRGAITPKSVVASGRGLVFAQNMMYTHTITVYDRQARLVRTIPDAVKLPDFGFPAYPGTSQGAPVEAAFTPDGRSAYISNYSMYGPALRHQGDDVCSPGAGIDPSFLYRVDVATLRINQVIKVGSVPKYVAVSPDGKLVLVTNWCSWTLSVVDAASGRQIREVSLGRYPRGIAVDTASRTAYVAVMGATHIAKVDLRSFAVSTLPVGSGPRHVVIDPAGRWLYVTLNGEGRVAKMDLRTGGVVARVQTGSQPRSMAISADGLSLYVVNYASGTVSKLRSSDMGLLQTVSVNYHPIGITYDAGTGDVWVACYSGSTLKFRDA